MEIDEIGSNLLGQMDVLTTFLELYDVGKVKQKLIKNTVRQRKSKMLPKIITKISLFPG